MKKSIAEKVSSCLQSFQGLSSALSQPGIDSSNQIPLSKVEDEFARFKVWCGNIGAHRVGQRSLEYRLRDASHIWECVVNLVEDLNESLSDATSIVLGENTPWDQLSSDGDDSDEDHDGCDNAGDPPMVITETDQILADVVETVNCLLRLSVTIQNPAPHDRFMESASTDTTHYQPFDIQHVRAKYPQAEDDIIERLGKAISRRRQFFSYREAHHCKLSQGLDLDSNRTEVDGQSTIASSLPPHLKTTADPELGLENVVEDDDIKTDISQTSYATSVADTGKLRVPPLPKQSKDGPFQCPFCYMMISVCTKHSWKKHVFKDLRPYVCLWKHCLTPYQEFPRRHQWMEHVLQKHWRTWDCAFRCQTRFQSESGFRQHMSQSHPDAVAPAQLDAFVSLSERQMALTAPVRCPLCTENIDSASQYRRHVGRHQEELALFALPKITGEDEVEADQHDIGDKEESSISFEVESHSSGAPSIDSLSRAGGAAKQFSNNPPHELDIPVTEEKDRWEEAAVGKSSLEKEEAIKFEVMGRKFNFPFHLCNTWQGMKEVIRQAFLYDTIIGSDVHQETYSLHRPNGDIILPQSWEAMVEPGWTVKMHLKSILKKPASPPKDFYALSRVGEEPRIQEENSSVQRPRYQYQRYTEPYQRYTGPYQRYGEQYGVQAPQYVSVSEYESPPSSYQGARFDGYSSTYQNYNQGLRGLPTRPRYTTHGTAGQREELDRSFQVQRYPEIFFTSGRVFSFLRAQSARESYYSTSNSGYVAVCRMVVVRRVHGSSWCCPITTYAGRGEGIGLRFHAWTYAKGDTEPVSNLNNRTGLRTISIETQSPEDSIAPGSFVNFDKAYIVEDNVKVKPIGRISEESMRDFEYNWQQVVWHPVPERVGA